MSPDTEAAIVFLKDLALYFSLFLAFIYGYRQGRAGV